jgi:integrase
MASVRKRTWRSGGEQKTAWVVDYTDQDGKRRLKTCRTKKEADQYLTTCQWEIRQGTHTPASASITVSEAIDLWLDHGEAEGLERGTLCTYTTVAKAHVAPIIGRYRLAQLSRPIIEQFRDDLLTGSVPDGKKRSRVMARKALGALKMAINEAQRRGRVAQNVAVAVQVAAHRGESRRKEIGVDVPSKEEVRAILEAVADPWRPLVVTTVFCGLRASGLCGLRWSDVDFEAKLLRVRQRADRWGAMGQPKSAAGRRDVPMAPIVLNTLQERKLASPISGLGLVFPAPRDGGVLPHATLYKRAFGDAQRARGIVGEDGKPKYGPHAFRHFCASWLIEQGFGPKRIMGIMGHASVTMTFDVYGHLFPAGEEDHERLAAGQIGLVG